MAQPHSQCPSAAVSSAVAVAAAAAVAAVAAAGIASGAAVHADFANVAGGAVADKKAMKNRKWQGPYKHS